MFITLLFYIHALKRLQKASQRHPPGLKRARVGFVSTPSLYFHMPAHYLHYFVQSDGKCCQPALSAFPTLCFPLLGCELWEMKPSRVLSGSHLICMFVS